MIGKFSATHAALIGIILAISGFITWSAVTASAKLDNLVVVAPVAGAITLLAIALVVMVLLAPVPGASTPDAAPRADAAEGAEADEPEGNIESGIWGDMLLLAGFAVFCFALTRLGFDIATFLFVWAGVVVCGGRGWWQPPVFAAVFTVLLIEGFGSLFPYPMLTLVL